MHALEALPKNLEGIQDLRPTTTKLSSSHVLSCRVNLSTTAPYSTSRSTPGPCSAYRPGQDCQRSYPGIRSPQAISSGSLTYPLDNAKALCSHVFGSRPHTMRWVLLRSKSIDMCSTSIYSGNTPAPRQACAVILTNISSHLG